MRLWILPFALLLVAGVGSSFAQNNPVKDNTSNRQKVTEKLDARIHAVRKANEIEPVPRVDDAGFLRRICLDLTGTLPTPEEIETFLKETDVNKRSKAIDRLLASEAYANHWANYWDAILMSRLKWETYLDRDAFKNWLRDEFRNNTSWDKFVGKLITAEGYNTNGRPKGSRSDPYNLRERYNPATNYFLRYYRALPEGPNAMARTFLGVQIQCAQCHDHPTEKWTQQDFRQFTAIFSRTWPVMYDKYDVVGIIRFDLRDQRSPPPTSGKAESVFGSYREFIREQPKTLDGNHLPRFGNQRKALVDWMTAKENPWFARAIVNRMWGHLLGKGFVNPIDDLSPNNPVLVPEAFQLLTTDFQEHGHDLKRLLRVICNSEVYQRACRPNPEPASENLWASYPLKSLAIETLLDVVLQATDGEAYLDKITKGQAAKVHGAFVRQFVTQMGTDDMAEVMETEDTIPRALMFLNGNLINGTTRATPGLALAKILKKYSGDEDRIRRLYLRTLSRPPSANELQHWLKFINQKRKVVPAAPPDTVVSNKAVSPKIANAGDDADFKVLLTFAKTPADFRTLEQRMETNLDAELYRTAFDAWAAEYPFRYIAAQPGGQTAKEQAYEDLFWALLNSSEFLSNH